MTDSQEGEEKREASQESGAKRESTGKGAWESVKEGLSDVADTASLYVKIHQAENRRRRLYTKLGETTYALRHPRHGTIASELEETSNNLVAKITDLNHEITDLKLKVKMKKVGLK